MKHRKILINEDHAFSTSPFPRTYTEIKLVHIGIFIKSSKFFLYYFFLNVYFFSYLKKYIY